MTGQPSTALHNDGRYVPKRAFPFLYFIVYLLTLYTLFYGFVSQPNPAILSSVSGHVNQMFIRLTFESFAFVVCLYMLAFYVRLEIFESSTVTIPSNSSLSTFAKICEFLFRLGAVAIVTAKILNWHVLSDIFLFLGIMNLVFAAWHVVLRLFLGIPLRTIDVGMLVFTAVIAIGAHWLTITPERQETFAMPLYGAAFLCTVFLAVLLIHMVPKSKAEVFEHLRRFVKW